MTNKTLKRKVEAIKKKKIVSCKVVSLDDFRSVSKARETKSVLVVDDDEVMRNALKRILEGSNYKVHLAEDGLELSTVLENTHLDMILLDVNLPWVNGFELCRLIKESPSLKFVPLIMVTAQSSQQDIKTGMEAGADDYVTKPFDVDHILGLVDKMIYKRSG